MAIQLSTAVRNARLDAIETTVGTSAVLKLRTGAQPANCAAADSGTVVSTLSLPSDWMAAASGGTKALLGSWADALADATGNAAHFRIYASDGTTCGMQGSVTIVGSGGDITLVAPDGGGGAAAIAVNQPISIATFTLTDANS